VIEFNLTLDFNNISERTNVALKVMRIYFGMDTRVCASCMLEISWLILIDSWGQECPDNSTARERVVEHGKHSNVALARLGFTCQHKSVDDFKIQIMSKQNSLAALKKPGNATSSKSGNPSSRRVEICKENCSASQDDNNPFSCRSLISASILSAMIDASTGFHADSGKNEKEEILVR